MMVDQHPQRMQCMEVWGGNQPVDSGVIMQGLDAWVYARPFDGSTGGGDVYYVSSCATGRINRLLVADVAGHGSAAGDVAARLRTLMRRYINYVDQTQFVRSMNRGFGELARSACFATAIVTTFFAPNNHLSLCNAGHPPPLLYRMRTRRWSFLSCGGSGGSGGFETDEPSNMPLGVERRSSYEQFEVRLNVGDLVICYTDSLIEAADGDGPSLGPSGLLEIVQRLNVSSPATLIAALLSAIEQRAPHGLSRDDVTVLVFRPNGLAPRVPWSLKLKAPWVAVAGIARSVLQREGLPLPDLTIAGIGGAVWGPLGRMWRGRHRLLNVDGDPSPLAPSGARQQSAREAANQHQPGAGTRGDRADG